MNQYAVTPNDQHLWLDDVELVGGDKMLMQLDITPRCIVVLKVCVVCLIIHQLSNRFSLFYKVDESKSGSLMDEFVKDVAANNMGKLLNNNIIILCDKMIYFRCKREWV